MATTAIPARRPTAQKPEWAIEYPNHSPHITCVGCGVSLGPELENGAGDESRTLRGVRLLGVADEDRRLIIQREHRGR
jgi:hypothetical protein